MHNQIKHAIIANKGVIMKLEYKIKKQDTQKNINQILKTKLNISARLLNKLIKNNQIIWNQGKCDTRNFANPGDILEIHFDLAEDNTNIVPTKMELNIIYEDEWFMVVNKPAGIPIHPSRLHYMDSLSNGIKFYFDAIGLAKKIRPVNRLDLDTSGLVIFAKCEYIQECLIRPNAYQSFSKRIFVFNFWYFRKQKRNHFFTNC